MSVCIFKKRKKENTNCKPKFKLLLCQSLKKRSYNKHCSRKESQGIHIGKRVYTTALFDKQRVYEASLKIQRVHGVYHRILPTTPLSCS